MEQTGEGVSDGPFEADEGDRYGGPVQSTDLQGETGTIEQ